MNVLHIDEQRGWRGGEQQASYLIQGLADYGHRAVVAGRPGSDFVTRDHGGSVIDRVAAPFIGEADLWSAYKLSRTVRKYDIDIIHAHTSHAHTYACLARLLAGQGKVIVSRRVDVRPRRGRINRLKYRLPDRFVAISQRIAAVLREYGIPESRTEVVYSAIDPARLDTPPIDRAELGISPEAPVLGNVAALEPHKDQMTLLDALPAVLRVVPSLQVIIAGEGRLRPVIENKIHEMGLDGVVHLLGYRRDVPALLQIMDAFVLSSRQEGLGTSLQDAMVCGLPVVATAAGGIPELVRHEETGVLASVGDAQGLAEALTRVLTDAALTARLGERAKAMILEHFTVDRMIAGNLRVYESVLEDA